MMIYRFRACAEVSSAKSSAQKTAWDSHFLRGAEVRNPRNHFMHIYRETHRTHEMKCACINFTIGKS